MNFLEKEQKRESIRANQRAFRIRQCKCGRKKYIPINVDKLLCDWCHNYIFIDKKAEFEYRIKEKIRKG